MGSRTNRAGGRAPDVLAAIFLVAGVIHFVKPEPFAQIVPRALPRHTELVYLSGVAELVCGLGLFKRMRWAPYLSTGLLVAVFPANVQMAVDYQGDATKSALAQTVTWARLPLQIPLVWMALRARRLQVSGGAQRRCETGRNA